MSTPRYSRFPLATGEAVLITHHEGATIRTTGARLWITQSCAARDVVLESGDAFRMPAAGVLRAQAGGQTMVSIERPVLQRPPSAADRIAAHASSGARR